MQPETATFTPWVVLFCRIALGLVFGLSAISKVFKIQLFVKAVANFRLLPNRLSGFVAYLFVAGEILTVILLFTGFLTFGFLIAGSLLLLFSIALTVTLWRKMQIACNCFGPTQTIISVYDLWRNGGFFVCAVVGFTSSKGLGIQLNLTIFDNILVAIPAVIFVVAWIHLNDIVWLLQEKNA